MLIAGVIVFCVLLLILAFLFPRLSRHPERGGQKVMGTGSRGASKAPGQLGQLALEAVQLVEQGHLEERQRRPARPQQGFLKQGAGARRRPCGDGAALSGSGAGVPTGVPVASSPARSSRSFSR